MRTADTGKIIVGNLSFLKVVLLLFIVGVSLYLEVVSYPFVHDDVVFILNNPHIGNWDKFSEIFFRSSVEERFFSGVNAYYRPVLEFLYRLQYRFFHFNPFGYHSFNILAHIFNSVLLYTVVRSLSSRPMLALAGAVLFLVHPVQTEAVACVSGVSNLLFSLFALAAFRLYIMAAGEKKSPYDIFTYVLALLFYILALLSKEQAVVLLGIIALYEFCFRERIPRPLSLKFSRWLGFLAVTLGFLFLRKMIVGKAAAAFLSYPKELFLRLLAIPQALLTYLKILFVPQGLHYYRSLDILAPFAPAAVIFAVVVLIVILAVRLSEKEDRRLMLFGLGWFFVTLLPLFVLPLIIEYSFIMTAEHFLYFPLIGFLIFILTFARGILKPVLKNVFAPAAAVVMLAVALAFSAVTIKQNAYWRGEVPLFERALEFEPQLGRVHVLLARAYYREGRFDGSISEFTKAQAIISSYIRESQAKVAGNFYLGLLKGIHFDMAHAYEAEGQWQEAAARYGEALDIDPSDSVVQNNLGAALLNLGEIEHAKRHFSQAMALDPENLMAISNLAICYVQEKNFAEAERLFKKALAVDPAFIAAQQNLKVLMSQKNDQKQDKN